ncbi:flagellar hook-length control protein FliK [Alicyclobacillus macrosporangiidus]|uniref:Hook-length control protein FliK n=1 Tax=Alicyclobacillus macrosporangiidus TaxID=392015 RepID=A0A1I7IQJ8_9BACL|nr:flagellar hook-length control protein FliK [Alicyclobacillus macrosporangiidus]SFU75192.1 hook-length control protein FliK [Alicyclobacillus macrosporangiidus]
MRVMAGGHATAGSKVGTQAGRKPHTGDGSDSNAFFDALVAAGAWAGVSDGVAPLPGETRMKADKGAIPSVTTSPVQGGSAAHAGMVAAKRVASPVPVRDGSAEKAMQVLEAGQVQDGVQAQDDSDLVSAHGMKGTARRVQPGLPAHGTAHPAAQSAVSGSAQFAGVVDTLSRGAKTAGAEGDPQPGERGSVDEADAGSTGLPRMPGRADDGAVGQTLPQWNANVRARFDQAVSTAGEAIPSSFGSRPSAAISEVPGPIEPVDRSVSQVAVSTGGGGPGRNEQAPERPASRASTGWDLVQVAPAAVLNTPRTQSVMPWESGAVTTAGMVSRNDPEVPKQFAGFIVHQVEAGPDQVRVRVHPEGLGDVLVTVQRSEDGVQVQLTANQWATTQWLSSMTGQIADSVRASGVPVQMVQVVFGQTTSQTDSGGRGRHGNSGQGMSEAMRVQGARAPNGQSAIRPDLRDGLEA